MKRRHLAAVLLTLSFSLPFLPGCGRDKGSATPQAAQELAELRAEQEQLFAGETDNELMAEIAALLARFDKTADARLASSPHGITMLHLACIFKKPELARCLLLDGADPNARQLAEVFTPDMETEHTGAAPMLRPSDTPLTWAIIPQREDATAEELLPLVNLLVEQGAHINQPGTCDMPPLATAAAFITNAAAGETVFLRLMELGARCMEYPQPGDPDVMLPLSALVATNGWSRALEALLDSGAPLSTPALSALHGAAGLPERPGVLACAKLLLARGADVNALNNEGATPLYITAHRLTSPTFSLQEAETRALCEMMVLLLEHGADPLLCCDADPEFPGSCAADFIAMRPEMAEMLAAKGHVVPRRPIRFEATGDAFLAEICRASLFSAPAEEIAPHFGNIAALLFSPTEDMQQAALYADAFGHAVILLTRADAARAAECVAQLPLWREQKAWETADARTAALMQAILGTPELILPRATLLEHARRMDGWGVAEAAAVLVELLERDPSAEMMIEELCTDASLPIRAGALTARLLRNGLPAPRNHAVEEWMEEHGVETEDAPPVLRRALLLTSLDAFWYGRMTPDEVRALVEGMRAIGAPRAADFYAQLAPNLGNPEELERLTAPGGPADTARYELECATALFLWSQREPLQQCRQAAQEGKTAVNAAPDGIR